MNELKSAITLVLLLVTVSVSAMPDGQQLAIKTALKNNDWDEAMDLAEELVDDFPDNSNAHYLLASAIRVKMQEVSQVRAMFSLGDYKEALAKAIELDPQNIDARTEEIGFYLFAPGIAGGDQEFAAKRIEELKAVDEFSALQMESQLAAVNKDSAKQGLILEKMLQLKPTDSAALMQVAGFKIQQESYSQAENLLLKIDGEQDPGWPLLAQYQRAKWRILAKQESDIAIELLSSYQAEISDLNSDIGLPPEAAVYWRMALAYENKGDKNRAIEFLQKSLKIDKDFEPAETDLDRLDD